MADAAVSLSTQDARLLPLLGHLEELRKRIVFSVLGVLVGFVLCWSYADRIFGLMQQPIIRALRRHGLAGGLVYLNPAEPFNLYLQVALVGGLFAASPFVFYQLWLFIAPGLYRKERRYVLPFILSTIGLFVAGGVFGYKTNLPGVSRFPDWVRTAISANDHDRGIYQAVCHHHRWPRTDLRNANSGVLFGFDAAYNGPVDVAQSAVLHTCYFHRRSNRDTHRRHSEHVPFCRSDARALHHQHRSGLARQFYA